MNICIIGDGITSLSLAKNLINKKINVHIYHKKKTYNSLNNRTIGISKNNLQFFKNEIQDIPKKNVWEIKKIEIYSDKITENKILDFKNNKDELFYMIRNDELYKLLKKDLLKKKNFQKKKIILKNFYQKMIQDKKYDLIINCENDNPISRKYFEKKIQKDYFNIAYTAIVTHEKLKNNIAVQTFTKNGIIAYLPISNKETSVVCSLRMKKNKRFDDNEIYSLINKYNIRLNIKKISKISNFKLESSNLRNYYYKNILTFGDLLHKIHPLAGQGFNMTIRDIKILSKIIQNKINLGLQLDATIFEEFEKETKHINLIFSNGIDFIYEFFNFDRKTKDQNLVKLLKFFGKNEYLKKSIIRFADKGLNF